MDLSFPVCRESVLSVFESITDDKEFAELAADSMNKYFIFGEKSGKAGLNEEKKIRRELKTKIRRKFGLFYPERNKALAISYRIIDLCMYAYKEGYKAGRKEA